VIGDRDGEICNRATKSVADGQSTNIAKAALRLAGNRFAGAFAAICSAAFDVPAALVFRCARRAGALEHIDDQCIHALASNVAA
jgi:hypothetical protein